MSEQVRIGAYRKPASGHRVSALSQVDMLPEPDEVSGRTRLQIRHFYVIRRIDPTGRML
jgi:hypothetical protein